MELSAERSLEYAAPLGLEEGRIADVLLYTCHP
jgi:hypothetical protein